MDLCDDPLNATDLALWSITSTAASVARQNKIIHGLFDKDDSPEIAYHQLPDHVSVQFAMEIYIDPTLLLDGEIILFQLRVSDTMLDIANYTASSSTECTENGWNSEVSDYCSLLVETEEFCHSDSSLNVQLSVHPSVGIPTSNPIPWGFNGFCVDQSF